MKRFNPDNKNQARLFFCMFRAVKAGQHEHPVDVMNKLSVTLNFKILDKIPQSLFDGWDFWVEFKDPKGAEMLPPLFRDVSWKPIGQA